MKLNGLKFQLGMFAMSVENKVYRLRSCIALVRRGALIEFFDSNLRVGFSLDLKYSNIVELLQQFDGLMTVASIGALYPEVLLNELSDLVEFLHSKYVLIEIDEEYEQSSLHSFPRLINTLESYFHSTSAINNSLRKGWGGNVLIVGLGAVGTWVLHSLVKAGVKNITVMDDDIVEESNLHRQDLFFEADIGTPKVSAAYNNIKTSYGTGLYTHIKKMQSIEDLEQLPCIPDMIINCADYPSVDHTSKIVSDFCLKNRISHIIGGGYNLHLTLVGQVVIPGVTACFHCFDKVLTPINAAELFGVKKLNRKYRKIGSLGPLCSISASITATEAIKLIFGVPLEFMGVINKRLEFNLKDFDFGAFSVQRNVDCEYCS